MFYVTNLDTNIKTPQISELCKFAVNIKISQICPPIFTQTSRVPVEGKSSVCLICIKYRIIILIIIIISLCEILLSYFANTYARTYTHTPPWRSGYRCSMGRWRPTVAARSAGDNGRRCFIQINTREGVLFLRFVYFFLLLYIIVF